jgi:predicted amidohydrolase YtcJ
MHESIVRGGRIHARVGGKPVEALLIREGRVVVSGGEAEAHAAASPGVVVVDVGGAAVTPAVTDAHVHLTAWALARRRVDLAGVRTLDAALRRIAAHPSGEWILGRGWDPNRWGAFPTRQALDAVAPDRPALLESHDFHAAWLNSAALRACGIDRDTPDPEGGSILRDAAGEPTGVLLENARVPALERVPVPSRAEAGEALLDAQREAHRLGVAGVHSVEPTGLADFGALRDGGELRLRVLQHLPLMHLDAAIEVGLRSGLGDGWLRLGGIKMFLDGALGSRTAWLREPYEGTAGDRGIQTLPSEEFRRIVARAAEAGLTTAVHAIGDAAVELALEVLAAAGRPAAMPHRIEHLQLCPPHLWERVARSGVVASMQPAHLRTDVAAAERHWGHGRSRGAYAFGALQRAGALLAFGSDVPVETLDPRPGLYAAVARRSWEGEPAGGWFPEHALTPEEALRAYTEGPAAAAGTSHRQGRLEAGYDADLVAWDRDPLACDPDELMEMRAMLTMVAGEVVHREVP